jgi:hypothetical protein
MIRATPAASPTRNPRISRSKLVFWAPLVGYWLLSILMAFDPQPTWVVVVLGSPLVLVALAISYRALRKPVRSGLALSSTRLGYAQFAKASRGDDVAEPLWPGFVLGMGAAIGVAADQQKGSLRQPTSARSCPDG